MLFALAACRSRRQSRQPGVVNTYAVFDTTTICSRCQHREHASVDRRGRAVDRGRPLEDKVAGLELGRHFALTRKQFAVLEVSSLPKAVSSAARSYWNRHRM
jgi:hypothetical protein